MRFRAGLGNRTAVDAGTHTARIQRPLLDAAPADPLPGEPNASVGEPGLGSEGVVKSEGAVVGVAHGEGELEGGVTREVSVGLDEGLIWDQGETTGAWQLEEDEELYDGEASGYDEEGLEDEAFEGEGLEEDGLQGEVFEGEGYDEEGLEEPLVERGLGGPYPEGYWPGYEGQASQDPDHPYRYEGPNYGDVPPYDAYAPATEHSKRKAPSRAKRPSGQHKHGGRQRSSGPWPQLVTITALAVVVAAAALAVTSAGRPKLSSNSSPGLPNAGSTTLLATSKGAGGAGAGTTASSAPPARPGPLTEATAGANSTAGANGAKGVARAAGAAAAVATNKEVVVELPPAKGRAKAPVAFSQVRSLPVTPSIERQLVDAWVATEPAGLQLTAQDVSGTVPGETYYAYDVPISTYFAIVAFQPSPALLKDRADAAQGDLQAFRDSEYVFSLQTGSVWTWLGVKPTRSCPGEWVPATVLAAWSMCGLKPPAA